MFLVLCLKYVTTTFYLRNVCFGSSRWKCIALDALRIHSTPTRTGYEFC
jgi:hypothetical protein